MTNRTIVYIFKLMGTLLVSLLLWDFVILGAVQKGMWDASNKYFRAEWDLRTGNSGMYTQVETQEKWDNTVDLA